eukprot:5472348-Prorocentrum_lima.AAC.1
MGIHGFADGREGDKALPFLLAKVVHEEPFRADDRPHEPQDLLLETLHKCCLKAEGLLGVSISFRREYGM